MLEIHCKCKLVLALICGMLLCLFAWLLFERSRADGHLYQTTDKSMVLIIDEVPSGESIVDVNIVLLDRKGLPIPNQKVVIATDSGENGCVTDSTGRAAINVGAIDISYIRVDKTLVFKAGKHRPKTTHALRCLIMLK